ncbi:hypothetical protein [Burkholderia aenigmatica]|uniref:hypothetical protein n=1 Tax=Burkholderia aenigmatica TaxID=2015348 RepID=UPI00264E08BB|nr:hypothetical protein [Burkholderia aenigmatica]MDN7875784.1 hypothetical protein [Burkholderia aenigmatica]
MHRKAPFAFSAIITTSSYRAITIGIHDDFIDPEGRRAPMAFRGATQGLRLQPHIGDQALRPG